MRTTDSIAKYPINLTKELKDLLENFKSINGYVRVTDALEFLLNESKSFNEFKEFFKKIPNHSPFKNSHPMDSFKDINAEDLINQPNSPQEEVKQDKINVTPTEFDGNSGYPETSPDVDNN